MEREEARLKNERRKICGVVMVLFFVLFFFHFKDVAVYISAFFYEDDEIWLCSGNGIFDIFFPLF